MVILKKANIKYFHLILSSDEENIIKLDELSKEIRKIIGKVCEGNKLQTLWDGIGFTLCKDAYPIIYEVENLLRKLITKFMLCNVGLSWHKESVPGEVRDSIKTKSGKDSANCLYEADFIQLSNFLFKEYSSADIKQFFSKVEKLNKTDSIAKSEIESYIPQSNWDRFFSDIVSCEKGFIEKRWERLYELRCMIAHNKQFSFSSFDEVNKIAGELKPKFMEAIENLEKVEVPQKEKEQVAESIAISRSDSYRKFIDDWNETRDSFANISRINMPNFKFDSSDSMKILTNSLLENNLINKSVMQDLENMGDIRNSLVHNINIKIPDSFLDSKIMYLDTLKNNIELKHNSPEIDEKDKNKEEGDGGNDNDNDKS